MTGALQRTYLTTQQFIVKLRTERPVVTDVSQRHTHFGTATTVITRTCVQITVFLVLVTRTVVYTIAENKHRQTDVLFCTPEVRSRACDIAVDCVRLQRSGDYISCTLKIHNDGKGFKGSFCYHDSLTQVFIGPIHTLLFLVTGCRNVYTLEKIEGLETLERNSFLPVQYRKIGNKYETPV